MPPPSPSSQPEGSALSAPPASVLSAESPESPASQPEGSALSAPPVSALSAASAASTAPAVSAAGSAVPSEPPGGEADSSVLKGERPKRRSGIHLKPRGQPPVPPFLQRTVPESEPEYGEEAESSFRSSPPSSSPLPPAEVPLPAGDLDLLEKEALLKLKMMETEHAAAENGDGKGRFPAFRFRKLLLPGCLILIFLSLFLSSRVLSSVLEGMPGKEHGGEEKGGRKKNLVRDRIVKPVEEHVQLLMNEMDPPGGPGGAPVEKQKKNGVKKAEEEKALPPDPGKDGKNPPPRGGDMNNTEEDTAGAAAGGEKEKRSSGASAGGTAGGGEEKQQGENSVFLSPSTQHPPSSREKEEDSAAFMKLLKNAKADEVVIRNRLSRFFRRYPDDLEFHRSLIRELNRTGRQETARTACLQALEENPRSYAANMLAATLYASPEDAVRYLERASALTLDSEEPYLRLMELHESRRDWRKVMETADSMLFTRPDHFHALTKKTEAAIRAGADASGALRSLRDHCRNRNFPPEETALHVLPLAQMFSQEELSSELLKDLGRAAAGSRRDLTDEYRRFSIYHSLAFGTPADPDVLRNFHSAETRVALILYYVSMKDFSSAFLIPTPPKEFPDFWKIFIAWYQGDRTWEVNAKTLLSRYETSISPGGGTVPSLLDFWQGKIGHDELRMRAETVPAAEEPLLYFILALDAERKGRHPTANVLYAKAMGANPGIYRTLIKNFMGKK